MLCVVRDINQIKCQGVRQTETGALLSGYRQLTEDQKEFIRDEDNSIIGFYHGTDRRQSGTMQGELVAGGAINDIFEADGKSFYGVQLNLNNPYDGYDVTAGSWYFDSIETSEERRENCTFTAEISRWPNVSGTGDCATADGLPEVTAAAVNQFDIATNGRAIDDIAADVIAANTAGETNIRLLDGDVTGHLTLSNVPPMIAANPGGVRSPAQMRILGSNNHLEGFTFLGTSSGGIRIEAPGNYIKDPIIDMTTTSASTKEGIRMDGSAYDPGNPTTIDGATINDWGYRTTECGIVIGSQGVDEAPAGSTGRSFIIKNSQILNGDQGNYSVPIQIFWPAEIENNTIDTWNGEGIQVKSTTGHTWVHHNVLRNNMSTSPLRGTLYDRTTNVNAINNLWEYNIVENVAVGIDHYGSSNTTYRNNIIYNYARPGRFNNSNDFDNISIHNNTFFNAITYLGVSTNVGWTLGGGSGNQTNISFRNNIWKDTVRAIDSNIIATNTESIYYNSTPPDGSGASAVCVDPASFLGGGTATPACALATPPGVAVDPIPGSGGADFTRSSQATTADIGAPWPIP